jgi:hypothetical protein
MASISRKAAPLLEFGHQDPARFDDLARLRSASRGVQDIVPRRAGSFP